jgi:NADH dehydrogenase FAD-containing subunit
MLRDAGLEVTDRGFACVNRGLRSSDPRVFVAGDSATVDGLEDLQKIGVHAVKHGPTLRENVSQVLAALARGDDPASATLAPFRPYPAAPLMLSTGEPEAWWTVGPIALRGRPALRLKHAVDRRWIDQYRDGASYHGRWDARAPSR